MEKDCHFLADPKQRPPTVACGSHGQHSCHNYWSPQEFKPGRCGSSCLYPRESHIFTTLLLYPRGRMEIEWHPWVERRRIQFRDLIIDRVNIRRLRAALLKWSAFFSLVFLLRRGGGEECSVLSVAYDSVPWSKTRARSSQSLPSRHGTNMNNGNRCEQLSSW